MKIMQLPKMLLLGRTIIHHPLHRAVQEEEEEEEVDTTDSLIKNAHTAVDHHDSLTPTMFAEYA